MFQFGTDLSGTVLSNLTLANFDFPALNYSMRAYTIVT